MMCLGFEPGVAGEERAAESTELSFWSKRNHSKRPISWKTRIRTRDRGMVCADESTQLWRRQFLALWSVSNIKLMTFLLCK